MTKKTLKSEVKEYTASCVSCGTLVSEDKKFVSAGRNYCTSCAIISKKEDPALKAPEGAVKWLCYFVSFVSPLAGFVLSIIFLSQKDLTGRSFGRHNMIVVCVSLAIISIFVLMSLIMSVLGFGGEMTGPFIGEGYY